MRRRDRFCMEPAAAALDMDDAGKDIIPEAVLGG
jgi:hypothetical protein